MTNNGIYAAGSQARYCKSNALYVLLPRPGLATPGTLYLELLNSVFLMQFNL